jgi:hypothetical protein
MLPSQRPQPNAAGEAQLGPISSPPVRTQDCDHLFWHRAAFDGIDERPLHATATWMTEAPEIEIKLAFPLPLLRITHHPPGTPLGKRTELARAFPSPGIQVDSPDREVNVHTNVKLTTVFGEPGKEDTRTSDFRRCLTDAREIVESFASVCS